MGRFGYEKDITNCIITDCWNYCKLESTEIE